MQFSLQSAVVAALLGVATASPTPTINQRAEKCGVEKRDSITQAANIGYATQNGGTTGGAGGATTTVSSFAEYSKAVEADGPAVVVVDGTISGTGKVRPTSDKTIVGKSGAAIEGFGHYISGESNVIIRNLKISKVKHDSGDAIGISESTNVWVDHVDLSTDRDHDKDYYDGLFDVKHGSDWVTISNSYIHDHWKASLVGHSDNNGDEDKGKLHVTFANNRWENINSRAPSVRFGTVHIYNSFYSSIDSTTINTRQGAQVLVESTAFENASDPITSQYSDNDGYATTNDVDLGGGENSAPKGDFSSVPYKYELVGSDSADSFTSKSGATLSF